MCVMSMMYRLFMVHDENLPPGIVDSARYNLH